MQPTQRASADYIAKLREIWSHVQQLYELADRLDDLGRPAGSPWGEAEIAAQLTAEDRELVVSLMSVGLFRANLFPILLRADRDHAYEFLAARYLGTNIDYDAGVTGFTSNLTMYFREILTALGEPALRELLRSERVEDGKLDDPRVRGALRAAIGATTAAEVNDFLARRDGAP